VSSEGNEVQEATSAEAPKRNRSLLRLIQAVVFIAVIVVVEVVVASMLVPSAQDTRQLATELAAASAGKDSVEPTDHAQEDSHDSPAGGHGVREVELGSYNITRFNPATNTTLAIDFELYGTVLAENATQFQQLFEHSQARIREQVVMSLHSANSADLTDSGLGLIKRRILEKTNRALGQPLVKEVLFSKFNFVER
jgi:flagellar basal body-associated protein FliL